MKATINSKLAIILTMLLSIVMIYGQTNENNTYPEKIIRIKLVENIDGEKTVIDTIISKGLCQKNGSSMDIDTDIELDIKFKGVGFEKFIKEDKIITHAIYINDDENIVLFDDCNSNKLHEILNENDEMENKLHKILTCLDLKLDDAKIDKIKTHILHRYENDETIGKEIISYDKEGEGTASQAKDTHMKLQLDVKVYNIQKLNKEDKKILKTERNTLDDDLKIDQVNLYPNPNNGNFKLNFSLQNEGDVEINIYSLDGQVVYTELLKNFTGDYQKEVDISKNANGVYYIRVTQGKDTWLKKMIKE